MRALRVWPPVLLAAVVLLGCPAPAPTCDPEEEDCTDGGLPPDACNTKEEALSDPQCALTLGTAREGHISVANDTDWYLATMPGTLTPRSLLHVTAGYAAMNTPVNLAVTVLEENGTMALVRGIDKHGQAAPRPVDLILPFSQSNAKLLVLVADEGGVTVPRYDVRSPYSVKVEVIDNPDTNEPNDTTPTPITLAAMGAVQQGQATGAIATTGDVDKFTFTAPAGRKVVYLRLTAPKLTPPPPLRLSYVLKDSAGTPVSEGVVNNAFNEVDLATARLAKAGAYTVEVKGYQGPNDPGPIPGDLRQTYTLSVQIFDDLDTQEPNDTFAAPKVVPLSVGERRSLVGRLGYVPDPDVFALDLAPNAGPGVLRYKLRGSTAAGRFAPLALIPDRQIRITTQITTGATAQDRQVACIGNSALCPKAFDPGTPTAGLVQQLCMNNDPPQCLWSERNEEARFTDLKNVEGAIPVPGHGATARYFLVVQDDGNDYADDKDYTLEVHFEADPDDTTRASLPAQTQSAALTSGSFPVPPGAGEVTGVLTHGHGRLVNRTLESLDRGEGIRGPNDYDAVPTDVDRFEFDYPGGQAAPFDRSWALQWEIEHDVDGGDVSGELALDVEFCDADRSPADGGTCQIVQRTLAFQNDRIMPWYGRQLTDRQVLWQRSKGAASTTVTAQAVGCFCFEPRFVRAGKFAVRVGAIDRNTNGNLRYRLRQGLASYPQPYSIDGGAFSCPAIPAGDAGCRFAQ